MSPRKAVTRLFTSIFGVSLVCASLVMAPAPATAATYGPWTGTISVHKVASFLAPPDFEVRDTEDSTIAFTSLSRLPSEDSGSFAAYKASVDVKGTFSQHWAAEDCDSTAPFAYKGPSVGSQDLETNQWGYGDSGHAFSIQDEPGKSYFLPSEFGIAYPSPICSSVTSDDTDAGGLDRGNHVQGDPEFSNMQPLTDTDSAAGHLVGTTHFTLANPPYLDGGDTGYSSYSYTLTYDLHRTAQTAPSAPRIGTAHPGGAGKPIQGRATWSAPLSNGGAAIKTYRVVALRYNSSGAIVQRIYATRGATIRSHTFTLPAGRYKFRVQATNAAGTSAWSATSNTITAR